MNIKGTVPTIILMGDIYQLHNCTNNYSGIKPSISPRVYTITIQHMKFSSLKSSPAWNCSLMVKPKYLVPTLRKNRYSEWGEFVAEKKQLGSVHLGGSISFLMRGIKCTGPVSRCPGLYWQAVVPAFPRREKYLYLPISF